MGRRADLSERRILIVEDEYIIALDLARAFERNGAVVVGPAATVQDALQLIAGDVKLDGAVLDVSLRNELVFPVADALRQRKVPYVFASGYDAGVIPDVHRGVRHCEKPVQPEVVAEALFPVGPASA